MAVNLVTVDGHFLWQFLTFCLGLTMLVVLCVMTVNN